MYIVRKFVRLTAAARPAARAARAAGLVDPLREHLVLVRRDLVLELGRAHRRVLAQVDHALPLEELDRALFVRLAAEVAVRGGHVVLGLAEAQVARERGR